RIARSTSAPGKKGGIYHHGRTLLVAGPRRFCKTRLLFFIPMAIDCVSPNPAWANGNRRRHCPKAAKIFCRKITAGQDSPVWHPEGGRAGVRYSPRPFL